MCLTSQRGSTRTSTRLSCITPCLFPSLLALPFTRTSCSSTCTNFRGHCLYRLVCHYFPSRDFVTTCSLPPSILLHTYVLTFCLAFADATSHCTPQFQGRKSRTRQAMQLEMIASRYVQHQHQRDGTPSLPPRTLICFNYKI